MAASVSDGEYRTEFERLKFCRFLVIDDIGAESVTEWNRDAVLLPVLDARYEDGLATWFTSNCDYESLKSHFMYVRGGKEESLKASRILERIQAMCEIALLTGKDRRNGLSMTK
jgi:primosomal protein DnaI